MVKYETKETDHSVLRNVGRGRGKAVARLDDILHRASEDGLESRWCRSREDALADLRREQDRCGDGYRELDPTMIAQSLKDLGKG